MFRQAIILLTVVLVFISNDLKGQQQYILTQYMFNGLILNPAYAGVHETWSFTLMSRRQWSGIEGAPVTHTLSGHGPIGSSPSGSVGFQLINDRFGAITFNNFYASYAYRISFDRGRQHLSFGMQGGISTFNVNMMDLGLIDPDDPALNGENTSDLLPNFGAGVYYNGRKFYAGISAPFMLNNRLNQLDQDLSKQQRHYYFTAGSELPLSLNVKLKPSMLLRYVAQSSPLLDLNMSVVFNDVVWFGTTYRINNSFGFILELQLTENLRFGYSYDLTTTALSSVTSGSHEFVLNYRIKKKPFKVYNPRRFK